MIYPSKGLCMDLKSISFCDGSAQNVCSNEKKREILARIEKYGVSSKQSNIRMYDDNRHGPILKKHLYWMSLKSIGNTYFLFLTKEEGSNCCYFIDKKILKGYDLPRIIFVRYRFKSACFQDTLFEGDLVKTQKGWKFVMGDLLVGYGRKYHDKPFVRSMFELKKILSQSYVFDPYIETCCLLVKK